MIQATVCVNDFMSFTKIPNTLIEHHSFWAGAAQRKKSTVRASLFPYPPLKSAFLVNNNSQSEEDLYARKAIGVLY